MGINVNLELTDHCNIRCKMCSQSLRKLAHGAPHRFMTWDVWRNGVLGLDGFDEDVHLCPHWLGEPTLHPEFETFIEYAFAVNVNNRLFKSFKLHTNAVLFSEERAIRLLRLANSERHAANTFETIHFSIDAFSRDVYDVVKGADRREVVYENVARFLALRHERQLAWPRVHIAFVVQPDNAHEARDFVNFWGDKLDLAKADWDLTWDWPSAQRDAVYLRPLNSGDQDASDDLHASVCRDLGLTEQEGRLRAAESF